MAAYEALDALVDCLAGATWKEREPIKKEIQELAATFADRKAVLEHLATKKKDIGDLEARWEIDEVIEALTPPPPPPEPAKDEKKPGPEKQLSAADLVLVYDDPRGLLLHRTKVAPDRWFATQRNPQTGQPQTFELRAEEVTQLKTQLTGSPYWVIGRGLVSPAGLALALAGCGSTPTCTGGDVVLAEHGGSTLACRDAGVAHDWLERLAGRPLTAGDGPVVDRAVAEAFRADPEATRAWLAEMASRDAQIAALRDLAGAEARASAVYEAHAGRSLVDAERPGLWTVQKRALAVWAHDDTDRLALTEADVEGWIRYASLCREAQGGIPLRISVADRVAVYRMLVDRFGTGTRADRIALSAVGGWWSQIDKAWAAASYDEQRAWIAAAPLPPPMTATSLGYAEAVFQSDVAAHARVLTESFGPFRPTELAPTR